ncbi:signal peptidase II [Microvirga tunisiensis]|uniref:Signal peptidase II n=2 Tax=Pannonibacter tanglangensis TaxID=2750084 RepID=A0ABW9ZID9_9HYPH|nr:MULTISPECIES: signal peptidase II [unclassified Pannonibacter]NBN64473.1 signal peptidase II [Pannonibacter sp. XCT-34]NBN79005.1 signal peptidase II [Pannonibacter sp. XCT-53]
MADPDAPKTSEHLAAGAGETPEGFRERWLWGPASRGIAWLAGLIFLADQASKLWLLFVYDLPSRGVVDVLPFLQLVTVWNRGISYGLLQQETDLGRWALAIFTVAAAIGLWVWSVRGATRLAAVCFGLLIGGALGNGVDRFAYGAVYDFLHLHWGDFSWYVFNVADAAIVAGVLGLLYDGFAGGPNNASKSGSKSG